MAVTAVYPDLFGKHALVTGGAGGIGEAVARAFVGQGCRVTILDKDTQRGSALAAESKEHRSLIAFYEVDLADAEQLIEVLSCIDAERGVVDVLVNNAANDPRYDFLDMTAQQWDDLFALNVRHYFLTCRHLLPPMIERGRGGSIIMVSSIVHFLAPADVICYAATKSAIVAMVRSLGQAVGKHDIRVNAVAPGWIMTERQRRDWVTPEIEDKLINEYQALPRLLTPEDVAPAFLFLASNASAAITRQTILVDGGWRFT